MAESILTWLTVPLALGVVTALWGGIIALAILLYTLWKDYTSER